MIQSWARKGIFPPPGISRDPPICGAKGNREKGKDSISTHSSYL